MNTNTPANKEIHSRDRVKINRDEIARRACQLWEAAGQFVSRDAEYWLQAEAEILATAQRGLSLETGGRGRARSTNPPSRLPQPFQDTKPAQKVSPMQEQTIRR
jgi:hypothetical protein